MGEDNDKDTFKEGILQLSWTLKAKVGDFEMEEKEVVSLVKLSKSFETVEGSTQLFLILQVFM